MQVIQEIVANSLGIPITIKTNYDLTGTTCTLIATPPGGGSAQEFNMVVQSDNKTAVYVTGTKTSGTADFVTVGNWQLQMKIVDGSTIRVYTVIGILKVDPVLSLT